LGVADNRPWYFRHGCPVGFGMTFAFSAPNPSYISKQHAKGNVPQGSHGL